MKQVKRSEVPKDYRKSRKQQFKEFIEFLLCLLLWMGIGAFIAALILLG